MTVNINAPNPAPEPPDPDPDPSRLNNEDLEKNKNRGKNNINYLGKSKYSGLKSIKTKSAKVTKNLHDLGKPHLENTNHENISLVTADLAANTKHLQYIKTDLAEHEKVLYPQKQQKNENNSTLHVPRIDSLQTQTGSSKQVDSEPELKLSDLSLNSFKGASIFTSQSPSLQIGSSQIELGQNSISAPSKALTTVDFEQTNERANFKAIKNPPAAENLGHESPSVSDEQEQSKQETKQATLLENNNYKPSERQERVADNLSFEVSAVSKSAILLAEIDPEDLNKDQIDEALIVDAAAQEAAEQIFVRRELFIKPKQFAEAEQEQKEDEVLNQQQNEEEEMSKVQSLSIPITPTNPDELHLSSSVPSVSPSNKMLAVKTFDELELDMKVKRLFTFISEGEFRIGSKEDEAVLIVGLSEEGKSTLADELSGKELSAVKPKGTGRWLITPTGKNLEGFSDSGRTSPIGNDRRSETTIPYKFKIGNKTVYDTPGIDDNRGMEQEIANSYYIKRIIDQSNKIKIMFTLNHSKIQSGNGDELIKVISHFIKMFKNPEKLENCISLVITKADAEINAEGMVNEIKAILKDNPSLANPNPGSEHELVKKMIENLKQSVKIYYAPQENGVLNRHLKLEDFEPQEFYVSNDSQIIDIQPGEATAANASPRSPDIFPGNHLTGNHTVLLHKYKAEAEQMLTQVKTNVNAITGFIVGFFSNLLENSKQLPQDTLLSSDQKVQNVFSEKFDLFIKEWLPESFFYSIDQMHKEFAKPECRTGDLVRLEQLKLLKDELALESQSTKPELDKLVKILKILKKFVTERDDTGADSSASVDDARDEMKDNGPPVSPKSSAIKTVSQQLECYIKTLKLLSEYQIFFEDLCEKPHENLFAPAAQECTNLITSLFNSNVLTLKNNEANPSLKSYSYDNQRVWHQKAIKWLDQYPDQNNEIIAAKANHHYNIGKLYGLDSATDAAINSFNEALSLFPEMECAKNGLGRMYFEKAIKNHSNASSFKAAQYGEAWTKGEIDKALENYNQALKHFISTRNSAKVENIFSKILALETSDEKKGEIYSLKGDYFLDKYPLEAFKAYDFARGLLMEHENKQNSLKLKMKIAADLSAKPITSIPYFESLLGGQSNSSESASAAASSAVSQNNYDEVFVAGKDTMAGAVNTDFQ